MADGVGRLAKGPPRRTEGRGAVGGWRSRHTTASRLAQDRQADRLDPLLPREDFTKSHPYDGWTGPLLPLTPFPPRACVLKVPLKKVGSPKRAPKRCAMAGEVFRECRRTQNQRTWLPRALIFF